jgi:hypothetical protein
VTAIFVHGMNISPATRQSRLARTGMSMIRYSDHGGARQLTLGVLLTLVNITVQIDDDANVPGLSSNRLPMLHMKDRGLEA